MIETQISEEERFKKAFDNLERKYYDIERLLEKAYNEDIVAPEHLLPSLLVAIDSIKNNYEELCEKYKQHEEGKISPSNFSSFLEEYILEYTQRFVELSEMDLVFLASKDYQKKSENVHLCDQFRFQTMEIARIIDEGRIEADAYIFRWVSEFELGNDNKDKSEVRAKVKEFYPDLVQDDPANDNPHWFKRALERKTYEKYLNSEHKKFNNERVLELMKDAAEELSIEYTYENTIGLLSKAMNIDRKIDLYERKSKIKAQQENMMVGIQRIKMGQQ